MGLQQAENRPGRRRPPVRPGRGVADLWGGRGRGWGGGGGAGGAGVVAGGGGASRPRLKRTRRSLLPVYSLIVLTEPLGETVWKEIGWREGECLASFRLSIDY